MTAVSDGAAVLIEDEAWLFSAGVRADYQPCRDDEALFAFLDRVRQPVFERIRTFYEDAFRRYPAGKDRKDLRGRFRSRIYAQHTAARWELFQFALWTRLGFTLTPHPDSGDGIFRDFLVTGSDSSSFYLECAVDTRSEAGQAADLRWAAITTRLRPLLTDTHGLMVDRHAVGLRPFPTRALVAQVREGLAALGPDEEKTLVRVAADGWQFEVRASPRIAGRMAVAYGGGMSIQARLYDPIRRHAVRKARRTAGLDRPLVVAVLLDLGLPILEKRGAVAEALFGQPIVHATSAGHRRVIDNDGVWADAQSRPRRTGVSALLLGENVLRNVALPTLHHHPAARRPFMVDGLPLRTVRYAADHTASATEASATLRELFGLPRDWPGPEDPFEGVMTATAPPPAMWHPEIAVTSQ